MGLLDQVLGSAFGGSLNGGAMNAGGTTGGYDSGAIATGTTVVAPSHENALQAVANLLHSPGIGGVAGLLQLFQQHGMGGVANGWVSNGPNPPVSPSQLTQVLGQGRMSEFANQLGVPQEQAAGHLSQLLPHVIDQLTPNGQVPQQHSGAGELLDVLKSRFLG